MGKLAQVVKLRVCLNCKQTVEASSGEMKKHFIACCEETRNPPVKG